MSAKQKKEGYQQFEDDKVSQNQEGNKEAEVHEKSQNKFIKSQFQQFKAGIQEKVDTVKQELDKQEQKFKIKAQQTIKEVKSSIQDLDQNAKKSILNKKKEFNQWVAHKCDEKVIQIMNKLEPKLIAMATNPEMPNLVKTSVHESINIIWQEVTEMVRLELRIAIDKPEIKLSTQPQTIKCLCCWYIFRNTYLYALFPYDRNIWQQIKTFWWWFFKIIQSIPFFGIQNGAFFILFLAIDKRDSFQLTNFILNYKNMQFLTSGCISAIIAYFQYFYCATLIPTKQIRDDFIMKNNHSRTLLEQDNPYKILEDNYCFKFGPGAQMQISIDLFTFFFQLILIWIAYIMLQFSQNKIQLEDEELERKKKIRGGRLKYFMIFDLLTFLLSLTGTILVWYFFFYIPGLKQMLGDHLGSLIFFAKICYGMLSFPFMIFSIGFFRKIFTNGDPTAYDKLGNAVPIENKVQIIYSQMPIEEKEEEADIEELVGKV